MVFRNIVQIPTVPVRVNEPKVTPNAFKDPFDRSNYRSPLKQEDPELLPAAVDANSRMQDSSFMSPIATPRRRRSGSFGSANRNVNTTPGNGSVFRNVNASAAAQSGFAYSTNPPSKNFFDQMTAMTTTLSSTINSVPKGDAMMYQPSPVNSPYQVQQHEARQRLHKLSPLPMVNVVSKSYYNTTYDVSSEMSAASWLGLSEVPDEWSESFRFVLGRYLHDQLKM